MKEFGVGIVGFGLMGRTHAYGYRTLPFFYDPPPAHIRLIGICDQRPDILAKAKENFRFEFATSDPRELIRRPDVQIVDVCTPNQFHKESLLAAIEAGKHIQCDKPLTATWDDAREVARALKNYRGIGQVTLNSRFSLPAQRASQMIREGFLGKITQFRVTYLHSGSVDAKKPMGWKQEAAAGGGVINDLASHALDLADWLVGPFSEVQAHTQILHPMRPDGSGKMVKVEAEDAVTALAKLRDGGMGIVEASKIATGTNDEIRVEIHGESGALRFNTMAPNYLEAYSAKDPEEPLGGTRGWKRIDTVGRFAKPGGWPGPKFAVGFLRSHVHCLCHFVSCVAENRPACPSLQDGVRLQYLLEQVRASARDGAWRKIAEKIPDLA